MSRFYGSQSCDGFQGPLDTLTVVVAQYVNHARFEMGARMTLCQQQGFLPGLGQPERGSQACVARPDDNRVVDHVARLSGEGKCSTSRISSKMRRSSCIWRS